MIEYYLEGDKMYNYIIGKVVDIEFNSITLDNNGIGYLIYVANPYSFVEGNEYKVYLYQQIKEDDNSLFGFMTKEEKDIFLKLISVKGLGCKMALPILAASTPSGIIDAIERENILYIKKFPKIGDKLARQIILDLKGKLNMDNITSSNTNINEELIEVLKGLGYKDKEIKAVIKDVDPNIEIELQVKEALKLLLK